MLTETLVFALVISLWRGGKLGRLSELTLREFWLVPLALLIQSGVYWTAVKGIRLGPGWLSPALDTVSYFLLLFFTLRNKSLPGIPWLALGILLNTLVISLNGGVMPVNPVFLPEANREALGAGQGTHGLMTSMTHLSFLADQFYLNIPGLQKQVFSLGDIGIDIGCFLLIYKTMKSSETTLSPK